jgi:hypothetical protein
MANLDNLAVEVDVLKKQMHALRKQAHDHEEYIDTVSSPLYKRLWWFCCGYRFRKVGRWYGN